MGKIIAETDLLEQMKDMISYSTNTMEDLEALLRQTFSEMCNESAQFYGLPYWENARYSTEEALNKVKVLTERLRTLCMVIQSVPQEYTDLEEQHIKALKKITAKLPNISMVMTNAMSANYPAGIQEAEQGSNAKALEQSLSNTVLTMEMANLAALSKVIEEEYTYEKVEPIPHMTYVEPQKKEDDEE